MQVRVAFLLWLSDSLRLSDKQCFKRSVVVRFFTVIGQAVLQTNCGCPILYGYRTSSASNELWLSDSLRLSDKQCFKRSVVVRFFTVIGQAVLQTQCGCPILFGGSLFYLFIDVRADDPDKNRHQQDDREEPDEMDGGNDDRVSLKSRREYGHVRQSTRGSPQQGRDQIDSGHFMQDIARNHSDRQQNQYGSDGGKKYLFHFCQAALREVHADGPADDDLTDDLQIGRHVAHLRKIIVDCDCDQRTDHPPSGDTEADPCPASNERHDQCTQ